MSATETPDPKPLRADARRNRERLLEAARVVFGEDGSEAQMDDVAGRAGLGVGTLYRHFPTKTALMAELVRQKIAVFARHAEGALEASGDPFDRLAGTLRACAGAIEGDAATRYAMGAGTEIWEAAAGDHERLLALFEALIAQGRRAGVVRADLTAADIPSLMCGTATSIERGFDWRRHLELTLDGLRPPARA